MIIAEVSGGSGDSKVIPSRKVDSVNRETRFPGPLIRDIVADTQSVPFIPGGDNEFYCEAELQAMLSPDGYQSLEILVPKLKFTAPNNLMCAVSVVVVGDTAVVDDGREVRVLVVVGTVVVTVGIRQYSEATKKVPGPKDRTKGHPFLDVPESEAVSKQIPGGSRHFETQLNLPVSGSAGNFIPDGSLSRLFICRQSDIVTANHRAPHKVPVRNSEASSWK